MKQASAGLFSSRAGRAKGWECSRSQERNLVERPHPPSLADGPGGFGNYTGACCLCAFSTEFKKDFPLTTGSPEAGLLLPLVVSSVESLLCLCSGCVC